MSTAASTPEVGVLQAEDIQRLFGFTDVNATRKFVLRRGVPVLWDGPALSHGPLTSIGMKSRARRSRFWTTRQALGVWLVEQMPAPARPERFEPLEQAAHERALDLIRDAIAREYLQIGPAVGNLAQGQRSVA